MSLSFSSRVVQLLCLSLAVVAANNRESTSTGWWHREQKDTFVAYPSHALDGSDPIALLNHSSSLPVVRVFQAFPETTPTDEGKQRVWPLFKSLTRRLYPTLGPEAVYYMVDGETFGCRERTEDKSKTVAVDTEHCHQHCIRAGRYCGMHELFFWTTTSFASISNVFSFSP